MVIVQYRSSINLTDLALFEVPDARESQIDELFEEAEVSAKQQEAVEEHDPLRSFDFLSHVVDQLEMNGIDRLYVSYTKIAQYL